MSSTVEDLKTTGIPWDQGTIWPVESARKPLSVIQVLVLIPGVGVQVPPRAPKRISHPKGWLILFEVGDLNPHISSPGRRGLSGGTWFPPENRAGDSRKPDFRRSLRDYKSPLAHYRRSILRTAQKRQSLLRLPFFHLYCVTPPSPSQTHFTGLYDCWGRRFVLQKPFIF